MSKEKRMKRTRSVIKSVVVRVVRPWKWYCGGSRRRTREMRPREMG